MFYPLVIILLVSNIFNALTENNDTTSQYNTTESQDIYLKLSDKKTSNKVNLPNCGQTSGISPRIVGGVKVDIKQYPWMVSFQKLSRSTYTHFCGGSVLNNRWLLTAGHCFHGNKHSFNKIRAMVGATNWEKGDEYVYQLDKLFIHEQFSTLTYANDIALVKVKYDIAFKREGSDNLVNSVCLPAVDSQPPVKANVYGWGLLGQFGKASSSLMKVVLDKYDTNECNKIYDKFVGKFTKQMMCYATPGKDACQGDSGGPLSSKIDGKEYQFGLVSFGQGCSLEDHPGIYTNVALYADWIHKTITKN